MARPSMAMSADFLAAYAKLPAQQQRGVRSMISRFGQASKASGLNYEKIANATDPNMRSLRIDGGYRAIVLKPAHGMVHVLLWADKHDDAYAWATRHACSINPETGALQVYEPKFEPQPVEAAAPAAEVASLFGALKRRELLRLGVPDEMVAEVHAIRTEAELDSMSERLPAEAYEGLFLYLAGDTYEQIVRDRESPASVDVEDFGAALRREDSKVRFVVIENDLALEEMLNAPLERWRVFLHPSQRRLVERDWNGPVRVLGGAGTGKTVVAMHRARWLAQRLGDGGRILFTTFTRNLAADLEYNLRSICSPEEMKRIEVTNLDRWVQRFLRGQRYRFRPVFSRDDGAWRAALERQPTEPAYSDRFYDDEWEQVIQANAVTTREEYLRIPRTGRGVRINRAARAAIWPVFEEYRARLAERGVMEVADCYRAAAALLAQDADYRFDAVIVDEAQDLSAPAWQLIRALAPNERNDLFITGDAHQRIYSRNPATLGRCGIDIRGRGRKLRLNYRTTEETRRWATGLLDDRPIDDLDGGGDTNAGFRSLLHGPRPRCERLATRRDQVDWLVHYLKDLDTEGEALRAVCVVTRTRQDRDTLSTELTGAGIEVVVLEPDSPDETRPGVRLATMHRVKGLEFDRIVVASANADSLPLRAAMKGTEGAERYAAETAERALLYVAATRAKRELTVLSFGEPSPLVV